MFNGPLLIVVFDKKMVTDSFSTFAKQEQSFGSDVNHNTGTYSASPSFAKRFSTRKSKKSVDIIPELDERVVKAAAYLKFILTVSI